MPRKKISKIDKLTKVANHNLTQVTSDISVMKTKIDDMHEKMNSLPCSEHTKSISEINGYMKSLIIITPILSAVVTGLAVYFLTH